MSPAASQAFQRFVAVAIATIASGAAALLASPELNELIVAQLGEGGLMTALILALLPPIIAAIAKYAAGPTEKVTPDAADGTRARAAAPSPGKDPGLFG